MSIRRRVHGPATVSGEGPSCSPSKLIIEPAGVVDTATLHGPLPTTPLVSSAGGAGSLLVPSPTGLSGMGGASRACAVFAARSFGAGAGVAVAAVTFFECPAASSAIASTSVAPAVAPNTQRRRNTFHARGGGDG